MWTSAISNKKQWTSIFGEHHLPNNIYVSYAMLDGTSINLNLRCSIEQATAPKKWLKKSYNEYEFNLYIVNIEDFIVENFNFSGSINISIKQDGPSYKIELGFANSCKAMFSAKNITIANIKAYYNNGAM
ncbi:hypothetical protein QLG12_07910 [Pseudomonas sp. V88_4]|uniref:Imm50 family immunity protein n=1 Tax=Pseudomonas sp. V88_4 TaxID=3044229 RepID=UPI00249E85D6|nr:Imm50 family immunity protein [Pseudomonas sp. V88_4]MDI3398124.1 hypothetical protein [Pseudomonas sp. V88_4]